MTGEELITKWSTESDVMCRRGVLVPGAELCGEFLSSANRFPCNGRLKQRPLHPYPGIGDAPKEEARGDAMKVGGRKAVRRCGYVVGVRLKRQ